MNKKTYHRHDGVTNTPVTILNTNDPEASRVIPAGTNHRTWTKIEHKTVAKTGKHRPAGCYHAVLVRYAISGSYAYAMHVRRSTCSKKARDTDAMLIPDYDAPALIQQFEEGTA